MEKNMLSLYEYLFDKTTGYLVFQETIVDRVLDDVANMFHSRKIFDEQFLFDLKEYLEKRITNPQLKISFTYDKKALTVGGEFNLPNEILLIFPLDKKIQERVTEKEILYALFHEISHFFSTMSIHEKLAKIKLPENHSLLVKLVPPPETTVEFENESQEKIIQFLKYNLQLKERPNQAFSIAFEIFENFNINMTTQEICEKNLAAIKKNDKYIRDKRFLELKTEKLQDLFQIQYFIIQVQDKKLQKQFLSDYLKLKELIDKYRKRFYKYCQKIDNKEIMFRQKLLK
jgi:hypothetical protein